VEKITLARPYPAILFPPAKTPAAPPPIPQTAPAPSLRHATATPGSGGEIKRGGVERLGAVPGPHARLAQWLPAARWNQR